MYKLPENVQAQVDSLYARDIARRGVRIVEIPKP